MPGGLLLGGFLQVSFQRFPNPAHGVLEAPPLSWGALPVDVGATGEAMVPMERGEAIWIGVSVSHAEPAPSAVCLRVIAGLEAGRLDLLSGLDVASADTDAGFLVPPTASIEGTKRPAGGWFALARVAEAGAPAIRSLELVAVPSRTVRVAEPVRADLPLHSLALGAGQPRSTAATCHARAGADEWDHARRAAVTVTLVSGVTFAASSDLPLPEPLHHAQPYGGWRLP